MPHLPLALSTQWWFSVTGTVSGAPLSFQSGISSSIALGSITAPDNMCAPTSLPFSRMQTADFAAILGGELFQADRRGKPGGSGADDDHVIVHRLAFAHRAAFSSRRAPKALCLPDNCPFLDRIATIDD